MPDLCLELICAESNANSITNNLSSLYSGWNFLHNRLSISNITELNYNKYLIMNNNISVTLIFGAYYSHKHIYRICENLAEKFKIIIVENSLDKSIEIELSKLGKKIEIIDYILEDGKIKSEKGEKEFGNEKNKLVITQTGILVIEFLIKY